MCEKINSVVAVLPVLVKKPVPSGSDHIDPAEPEIPAYDPNRLQGKIGFQNGTRNIATSRRLPWCSPE